MQNFLTLYCAGSDYAVHYRATELSPSDRQRLQQSPQLATRLDWQVSRAIKAYANHGVGVLSHCHGHAVWASHAPCMQVGVDIERIQERDVSSWHDTLLHPDECVWLQQRGNVLVDYYALWVLKESLIKAHGGEWADLAQVGLRNHGGQWHLWANGQVYQGQGRVWRWDDWLVGCVWMPDVAQVSFCGLGDWADICPQVYLM